MSKYLGTTVVLTAILLSACGTNDTLGDLNNWRYYGDVKPQKIEVQGNIWGIFDKPDEARMLIVPLERNLLVESYLEVANDYFNQSKRQCFGVSWALASATDNSIEILYSCAD